jgi:small conductance mechanosensitive channel
MDTISNNITLIQTPALQTIFTISVYFLAAWILTIISRQIVNKIFSIRIHAPRDSRPSPERAKTLLSLVSSLISFFFFLVATALSLLLFVTPSTLVWVLGLFSAAFGIAARPIVSDVLSGIGFLFNETFDIGEKVEFIQPSGNIQGVIEAVNLTTTIVRAPTGEQFTLPNGEIRVVRNFSRGKFSQINISLHVSPDDLSKALEVLKSLGDESFHQLEGQVEPWKVISSSNMAAKKVELTIMAKAVLGHGAELKLELIDLIHERMRSADIQLLE